MVDALDFLAPALAASEQRPRQFWSLESILRCVLNDAPPKLQEDFDKAVCLDPRLATLQMEVWRSARKLNDPSAKREITYRDNAFLSELAFIWDSTRLRNLRNHTVGLLELEFPMVGRSKELLDIRNLLLSSPGKLVTITGSGGVGKSTLAINVARDLSSNFENLWVVEGATIQGQSQFLYGLANSIGIELTSEPFQSIHERLSQGRTLLILDRVDGFKEEFEIVTRLLSGLPTLSVLATSRSAPLVPRQIEYPLQPLECGDEDEAVKLFEVQAGKNTRGFKLSRESRPLVSELCRKVSGLPLAITILAGCLSETEFPDLLTTLQTPQVIGSAEQALESTFSIALRLNASHELDLLQMLAQWEGRFTFDEALQISDLPALSVSDALSQLYRARLVDSEVINGRTHYHLHDSVRERVHIEAAGLRHAEYMAERADEIQRNMNEGRWRTGIDELMSQLGNMRRAVSFCVRHDYSRLILRFGENLSRTYLESGLLADFDFLSNASNEAAEETFHLQTKANMLGLQGALASRRSDEESCSRLWLERLDLCKLLKDVSGAADALTDLAWQCYEHGDIGACGNYLDQAEQLATESNARELVATARVIRARMSILSGDIEKGRAELSETLSILDHCQDSDPMIFVYQNLLLGYKAIGDDNDVEKFGNVIVELAFLGRRAVQLGWGLRQLGELFEIRREVALAARYMHAAMLVHNAYATRHRFLTEKRFQEFALLFPEEHQKVIEVSDGMSWEMIVEALVKEAARAQA